jgi:hypothetical protein
MPSNHPPKVGWIKLTVTLRWCEGARPLLCYMKAIGRDDGMEFKDEALMEMVRKIKTKTKN